MKITWTNCADAMPPINSIVLIRSEVTGMIKKLNGVLIGALRYLNCTSWGSHMITVAGSVLKQD